MKLEQIKAALANGLTVHWANDGYKVERTYVAAGMYSHYITHESGNCIGLTWSDGKTLNGQESEFYVAPEGIGYAVQDDMHEPPVSMTIHEPTLRLVGFDNCINTPERIWVAVWSYLPGENHIDDEEATELAIDLLLEKKVICPSNSAAAIVI